MIASLGMYDFGPAMAANDRFWTLIRRGLQAAGCGAPQSLTRGEGAYWPAWESPDLVLSQTCGYPFRARLHDKVTYVGTPDYGVEGCPPGYYCSVFVVRKDDPRRTLAEFDGARFAYNEDMSQSGWAAPQSHAATLGLRLHPALKTEGHRLSAAAVAEGYADIAALDTVTWSLMQHQAVAPAVHVIAHTTPTPGLPYITAEGGNADAIFAAVSVAITALSSEDRQTLRLRGITRIPANDYLAVPNPPAPSHFVQPA